MGKLVVVEGGDGVGKTTLGTLLGRRDDWRYFESPIGPFNQIKEAMLSSSVSTWPRFLYFLGANLHASDIARSSCQSDNVVLVRYVWSTIVYSAVISGASLDPFVDYMRPLLKEIAVPDFTFLMVADEQEQLSRLCARGEARSDADDRQAIKQFNARIRDSFVRLFSLLSVDYILLDTTNVDIERTLQQVLRVIYGPSVD